MRIKLSDTFSTKKLLQYAMPSILMMVFISVYSVVDGFFVGLFVGGKGLAAVNIVFPLIMAISSFGFMLGAGGSAEVARKLGEGKGQTAKEYFTMLTIATSLVGILLSLLCLNYIRPICYLMGASDLIIEDCVVYGKICLAGNVFFTLQAFFQSLLVTAERPGMGFALSIVSGITNMLLDWLFIGVLHMGLAGAALATTAGFIIGSLVPLFYFMSAKPVQLHFVKPVWDLKVLLRSMGNGSSEMVTNISRSLIALLFNIQLMSLMGEDGVAAISVMLYVEFVFTAVLIGFSMGTAPVIGFNFGARRGDQLKTIFHSCLRVVVIVSAGMFVISQLAAPGLIAIFIHNDPQLLQITVTGFRLFAISFLASGINIFASSYFTALCNGRVSAIISLMRTLILQSILILVLPLIIGINGIWIALPLAEILTLGLSFWYFYKNQAVFESLTVKADG
jgi:putative MATE family efflux protein